MWERASSAPRGSERFTARRRLRRRRGFIAFSILLLLLLAAAAYGLRQDSLRISRVEIYGADQSLADIARAAMRENYLGIVPRDSIFFFPAARIRADILAAHPTFAAISIFRNGLTGLSIKINDRVAIARWCGLSPTPGVDEYCYLFDASGVIYAAAATTTETVNAFRLYAPLEGEMLEPLRATLAQAQKLPAVFDFARELGTLGSPITHIVIREDEVDDYLKSGTRITYVLGHEQDSYTALVSALSVGRQGASGLSLSDGSLDYIDLRFDGKVYLKKKQ